MKLTDEQLAAVELFQKSRSLKINAFAGAGKTSTLSALGRSTSHGGLYLAFNKSIATEAQRKFPQTVDCRTTHSLALRYLPGKYRGNQSKLFDSLQGNLVAKLLRIEELSTAQITLTPRTLGYLTARTIQRFCQSGDAAISPKHVPLSGKLNRLKEDDRISFQKYLADLASHLWCRMLDPTDPAPLGHDGYLKLWSLNCPALPYDFILLDEAQDTNEAVLSVLRKQAAQLTLVGDRHQQIYEWRGAINAMESIQTTAESALTQSFRFGEEIAENANIILKQLEEEKILRGNPAISSSITTTGQARTVLCRTNAGVIDVVLDSLTAFNKPHVIGGVAELARLLEDVTRLKRRIPAESSELFGFPDWTEVVEFSESEEGESLKTFVSIVNSNGEDYLIKALQAVAQNEQEADLVVSTGHKAKGREWPSVRLHSDFEPKILSSSKSKRKETNQEATRLFYVASTRPQENLIVPWYSAGRRDKSPSLSSSLAKSSSELRFSSILTARPALPQDAKFVPTPVTRQKETELVSEESSKITIHPQPANSQITSKVVPAPQLQSSQMESQKNTEKHKGLLSKIWQKIFN